MARDGEMPAAADARVLMSNRVRKSNRTQARPPFECIALLLQGGGSLGAYQAGVYSALSVAHLAPDWVAGISIGAINASLIAGNPPETRVDMLRKFWDLVTVKPLWGSPAAAATAVRGNPAAGLIEHALAITASLAAMGMTLAAGK